MMKLPRLKTFLILAAAVFFTSCKNQEPQKKGESGKNLSEIEAIAASVLKAFQESDVALISPHLASKNEGVKQMTNEEFGEILRGWRREVVDAWDGGIDGVRYRHYVGTARNDYVAHVKFGDMGGDEIAVVKLVREDGKWLFDDLSSPNLDTWREGKDEFLETEESY